MTHIENILHILKNGITHQNSVNSNPQYISIGYSNLISRRESVILPNGNKLSSYIPFYFGPRMPMLYVLMLGANSVKYDIKSISSEDIVYCITSVEQIIAHKLKFLFSNGHAVSALTDFFEEADVSNIHNIIDQRAISITYWNDENDLDLKRRKEAEFLVEYDIPTTAISWFAVYNENTKQKLLAYGIEENRIAIRSKFYF